MKLGAGSLRLPLGLLFAIQASGCKGEPTDTSGQFIAFAGSFNGFHGWNQAPATPTDKLTLPPGFVASDGGGFESDAGVHDTGPMTVYWNQTPQSGSTEFPVKTIIVKETNETDPTVRQIFAMVNRGADYNASGAVNWEWFELKNGADGAVSIVWRGYGPQAGEQYGGNAHVCNDCHALAVSNDYVWVSALQLSSL